MRRTAFVIVFTLITFTSVLGQKFSLSEIIKLNNKNWDDFDTYVTLKGYQYQKTDDNDFSEARSYAFGTNNSTGKAPYFITKTYYKQLNKKAVAFQTLASEEYVSFKNQLKDLGFKYIGTKATDYATFLDYKNGKMEVSLASFKSPNNSGEMLTGYEISIVTSQ